MATGAALNQRQGASLEEAIQLLDERTDAGVYLRLLQTCSRERALKHGKSIHSTLCKSEHASSRFLQNMVMEMYGKCGSWREAYEVFENMQERNVVSWNIMATALAKNGHYTQALVLFWRMFCEGFRPDGVSYLTAVEACIGVGCVDVGRRVHSTAAESGYEGVLPVANSFINMYGRCGDASVAQRVFDGIRSRDVISWNCLLTAYTRNGNPVQVISLFEEMDIRPDSVTYILVLNACASLAALSRGREVHRRIVEDVELRSDVAMWNSLLNMYGKCKSVEDALEVFNRMEDKNVITWTGMISVYTQNDEHRQALKLFKLMELEGVRANVVTYVSVLDACAALGEAGLKQGRKLHPRIAEAGFLSTSIIAGNSLMNMYAKSGDLAGAQGLFHHIHHNNLVAWNTLLTMYVHEEQNDDALELLLKMDQEGVKPDSITYLNLVTAVSDLNSHRCRSLLNRITSEGMESDVFVGNALIMLHCKSSELDKARNVFNRIHGRSVVAWTTMVCGYSDNGRCREALEIFREMDLEGVEPDKVTFTAVVDACASLPCLVEGTAVHSRIVENSQVNTQLGNALINMYGRCGNLGLARATFSCMDRDLVSWNTILAALAQNGHGSETVEFLKDMNLEGAVPNDITLLVVMFGCGNSGMLDKSEELLMSMDQDFEVAPQVNHFGCVIDLLGKAGWLERAENLIRTMPMRPDARAWQTLLSGCNTHGDVERAARAAKHVTDMQPLDDAPYISLSNVYKSSRRSSDWKSMR